MAVVNSVSGPLDTADLGFTLMHEHILVQSPGVRENFPVWNRAAELEKAVGIPIAGKICLRPISDLNSNLGIDSMTCIISDSLTISSKSSSSNTFSKEEKFPSSGIITSIESSLLW